MHHVSIFGVINRSGQPIDRSRSVMAIRSVYISSFDKAFGVYLISACSIHNILRILVTYALVGNVGQWLNVIRKTINGVIISNKIKAGYIKTNSWLVFIFKK